MEDLGKSPDGTQQKELKVPGLPPTAQFGCVGRHKTLSSGFLKNPLMNVKKQEKEMKEDDFGRGVRRLYPLTKVTNKHLLPVYDRPMIHYPIQTLINAGIDDILIVTGGYSAGDFLKLLGNGKEFGLKHINYTYQEGEGGIAEALNLAEFFAAGDRICVVLGDNIIEKNVQQAAKAFRKQKGGAKILLKEVPDPQRFGVPELKGNRVVRVEEKPKVPKSPYAVIGIYFYDAAVFDIIKTLRPPAAEN